jgi:transketolase
VGLALAFKRKNADRHVYCVVGDGDIQEGMTTEAMRLASHWRLSNLVVVCDHNMKTSDRHSIEPHRNSVDEVKALGWWTEWCDGHDIKQIVKILEFGREKTSRPFYLEACTTKGKGVSFMERDPDGYHGSLTLSTDEAVEALAELGDAEKLEVNR